MRKKIDKIKLVTQAFLPAKLFRFIRLRPRVAILSSHLYEKIKYINKASWQEDYDDRGDFNAVLRKQGHILDKGLQIKNRERGHGLELSKELRINLSNVDEKEQHTTAWASHILAHHSKLQQGQLPDDEYADFDFSLKNRLGFEKLFSSICERRSIRHFSDGAIPEAALIRRALEGSIWAPSSCNRQTIVNYFTCNKDLARKCAKLNKGATALSGDFAFVSVCYDSRSYHLPHESLTGIIDASLGFQNVLLLIHSLGLGACVLNWSHADKHEEKNLRSELSIPDYCEIVFNLVVGFPKYGAPIPGKKATNEYILEVR